MFEVGRIYNRREELHSVYGGQQQGGISTPRKHPLIFLFTSKSGKAFGYEDGWDKDGTFNISGEGQRGDMAFGASNSAVRDHITNGKELHLFESQGKGAGYRYIGEFACMSWSNKPGKDIDGKVRQGIIFHLFPALAEIPPAEAIEDRGALPLDKNELRKRAYVAAGPAQKRSGKNARKEYFVRSQEVSDYVLSRSQGLCEQCEKPAPFVRSSDLSPYLEPHHILRLSDGGPDHPAHVAALCPNCHREAHSGAKAQEINKSLLLKIQAIEESLGDLK